MNPKEKIVKARAGLILDHPFFGFLALRLKLGQVADVSTMATDGQGLGYNARWVDGLSMEETKGVLAHEVMHIACQHNLRRQGRDKRLWNMAGDYAINNELRRARLVLPKGALLDPRFDGKSADEIYAELNQQHALSEKPDQPSKDNPGAEAQPTQGNQAGGDPDPGRCGEVRDFPGQDGGTATQAQLDQQAAEIKVALVQAAQQARAMGAMPANLDRMIKEIVEPRLDWRELLRRFVSEAARNDYSFSPPNRRYIHLDLYLPSLRSQELGQVVIAIDTSGSIKQPELDAFAAEISGLLEEYPESRATVIYCDTAIKRIEEFSSQDLPIQMRPHGGGGTDFRPPFDWVNEHGLMPACLVFLTDGACSRYPSPPDYPVLWVGTEEFMPVFGEFVHLTTA